MIPGRVSIYVATEPLDLRRSFDGLAAVVREVLRQDPLSGALFLFFKPGSDRVKRASARAGKQPSPSSPSWLFLEGSPSNTRCM